MNDIRISGSGSVGGGEYENVKITAPDVLTAT